MRVRERALSLSRGPGRRCRGAFYAAAFGALEERERARAPDGRQVALLSVVGGRLGVATEPPDPAPRLTVSTNNTCDTCGGAEPTSVVPARRASSWNGPIAGDRGVRTAHARSGEL